MPARRGNTLVLILREAAGGLWINRWIDGDSRNDQQYCASGCGTLGTWNVGCQVENKSQGPAPIRKLTGQWIGSAAIDPSELSTR